MQAELYKLPGSKSLASNSFPDTMSQWSTIGMSLYAEMNRVSDSYQVFMKTYGIRLYTHKKQKLVSGINVYVFVIKVELFGRYEHGEFMLSIIL